MTLDAAREMSGEGLLGELIGAIEPLRLVEIGEHPTPAAFLPAPADAQLPRRADQGSATGNGQPRQLARSRFRRVPSMHSYSGGLVSATTAPCAASISCAALGEPLASQRHRRPAACCAAHGSR
ncbi:MAG TPA: hypothetical protein VFN89_12465 [Solirubrobacterales bacterium]|nr:hypothetical protein [Solirubrobacterales bacterium]